MAAAAAVLLWQEIRPDKLPTKLVVLRIALERFLLRFAAGTWSQACFVVANKDANHFVNQPVQLLC